MYCLVYSCIPVFFHLISVNSFPIIFQIPGRRVRVFLVETEALAWTSTLIPLSVCVATVTLESLVEKVNCLLLV